ncbi:ATP/maltotriose-dependent transcriptional regulator MalT [Leifsonia sp. AK011]|uniref:helix-turn-helix transcriptional regulator n=1 Tax=Leifsonia sp. AK011 TaxID=2723075 RepID=UPI0015CD35C0|nr:LuxR C-terminal-related transcriptional regulator [Leifsonia sp. AK011]NYF10938.1 ATP/maltotriose-dependent transcriptional regulator MalT [Leifsonia sp. AK011]
MPAVPHAVQRPGVKARLDTWIGEDGVLLVEAPHGFGKTTSVASWLSERREAAIWISAGRGVHNWADLVRVIKSAIADLGLAGTNGSLEASDIHVMLQRLTEPLILVIDDAHVLADRINIDLFERAAQVFRHVRAIVITSLPVLSDHGRSPSRVVLGRSDLTWTAEDVHRVLPADLQVPVTTLSLDDVIAATGGSASGILAHYRRSDAAGAQPMSASAFRVSWAMERLRTVSDPGRAEEIVQVLAEFIEAPVDLLAAFGVSVEESAVVGLLAEGIVQPVLTPGSVEISALRLDRELRRALRSMVQPGSEPFEFHAEVADYFVSTGQWTRAFFHLARAGRADEAMRVLADRIDLEAGVDLIDLRDAVDGLPTRVLRARPAVLAVRVLLGLMPPFEDAEQRADNESHLLMISPEVVDSLTGRESTLVTAARVAALKRRGRAERARVVGRENASRLRQLPWEQVHALGSVPTLLWLTQADAELQCGDVDRAEDFARAASESAQSTGHHYLRFHSAALLAATHALRGDLDAATERIREGELYYALGGWPPSERLYPIALARFLLGMHAFDSEMLAAAVASFTAIEAESTPWITFATKLAMAYRLLVEGDLEGASACAALVPERISDAPVLIRTIRAAVAFDIHTGLGNPHNAARSLEGAPELRDHSLCLSSRWTLVRLVQGNARAALLASDACAGLGLDHSALSVGSALVRRAVAQDALGMVDAADSTFADALRATPQVTSSAHFFGIERRSVAGLSRRLAHAHPDLHSRTLRSVMPTLHSETAGPPSPAGELTRREIQLLRHLRLGHGNQLIADELFVSTNTVKTQLRGLYRKLGVTSRREALSIAETLGLLDQTDEGTGLG